MSFYTHSSTSIGNGHISLALLKESKTFRESMAPGAFGIKAPAMTPKVVVFFVSFFVVFFVCLFVFKASSSRPVWLKNVLKVLIKKIHQFTLWYLMIRCLNSKVKSLKWKRHLSLLHAITICKMGELLQWSEIWIHKSPVKPVIYVLCLTPIRSK